MANVNVILFGSGESAQFKADEMNQKSSKEPHKIRRTNMKKEYRSWTTMVITGQQLDDLARNEFQSFPQVAQPCAVCGEQAAGFHFGAFTCEGCKSFFGRSFENKKPAQLECKHGGNCEVTGRNRTSCKSCRYRKCMAVGMSKSGSRYGRRSNWFKIHCLLQKHHNETQSSPKSSESDKSPISGCLKVDTSVVDFSSASAASSSLNSPIVSNTNSTEEQITKLESPLSISESRTGGFVTPPSSTLPIGSLIPSALSTLPLYHPTALEQSLINAGAGRLPLLRPSTLLNPAETFRIYHNRLIQEQLIAQQHLNSGGHLNSSILQMAANNPVCKSFANPVLWRPVSNIWATSNLNKQELLSNNQPLDLSLNKCKNAAAAVHLDAVGDALDLRKKRDI